MPENTLLNYRYCKAKTVVSVQSDGKIWMWKAFKRTLCCFGTVVLLCSAVCLSSFFVLLSIGIALIVISRLSTQIKMKFFGMSVFGLLVLVLAAYAMGASVPTFNDGLAPKSGHGVRSSSVINKPGGTSVLKKKPCCVLYCTSGCRCCSVDDILAEGRRVIFRA